MSEELLDKDRWPHIYVYEIACRCRFPDCPYKTREEVLSAIDFDILDLFEEIRKWEGNKPLGINSGIRCKKHNEEIRGARYSPHVPWRLSGNLWMPGGERKSYAIDISIIGHHAIPRQFREVIREKNKEVRIGWKEYNTFIHIDMAYNHPNKNSEMERKWRKGAEW